VSLPNPDDGYAERRYFAWRASHPQSADDPRAAWGAAWVESSWRTLRANADLGLMLSEVVGRLETIERRLHDAEVDAEAEAEAQSVYWHAEVPTS